MQAGPRISLAGSVCQPGKPAIWLWKTEGAVLLVSRLLSSWLRKTQHNTCANLARQRHCWPQVSCLQPGIMAPIWFPQCEKSVLAIILSRSKGHDTQSSKIPSHSYWVGFPYCLNKLIKHQTPELTGPSFASHGRSALSRGTNWFLLQCPQCSWPVVQGHLPSTNSLAHAGHWGRGWGKHKWVNRVWDPLCQLLCSPNTTLRDFWRLRVSQNHSLSCKWRWLSS